MLPFYVSAYFLTGG